ncbi:MAG: CBS domain-containing protein [Gammaproteobacteria bacterium]|nr:CBS domain-containing protein [Gammaproteobacteria bacterium]NNM19889.1 CBS domain-containing protein [Gammaproteobacteria bacterium]
MTDDHPPSSNGTGTHWIRRMLHALAGEPRDRDELLQVLREAQDRELIDADARSMLEGVLDVAEEQVRDIMIPRAHMVVVERDADPKELLHSIVESGHSRFPVVGENRDEVVGILLAKDLLRFFSENGEAQFDIRECLRPAVFIPESKRLNVLLKEFRANRNHMAVVVDEYGGVSGLITIEDVIEQIVGEIDDEHDIVDEGFIQRESDTRFRVRALTRIEDFNDYFNSELSDEEYDTIGGLIMHRLGRLPRRGESVSFSGFNFKVMRADRRRIDVVQVTPTEENTEDVRQRA